MQKTVVPHQFGRSAVPVGLMVGVLSPQAAAAATTQISNFSSTQERSQNLVSSAERAKTGPRVWWSSEHTAELFSSELVEDMNEIEGHGATQLKAAATEEE